MVADNNSIKLRILVIWSILAHTLGLLRSINNPAIRMEVIANLAYIVQLVLQLKYNKDSLNKLLRTMKHRDKGLYDKYGNQLHKLKWIRNKAVHEGVIPSEEDTIALTDIVHKMAKEFIEKNFKVKFPELGLSDLIELEDIRSLIRKAEEYMNNRDYISSLIVLDRVIDRIIGRATEDYSIMLDYSGVLEKLDKMLSEGKIAKELYDVVMGILDVIHDLANSVSESLGQLQHVSIIPLPLLEEYLEHKNRVRKYGKYAGSLFLFSKEKGEFEKERGRANIELSTEIDRSYLLAVELALILQRIIKKRQQRLYSNNKQTSK